MFWKKNSVREEPHILGDSFLLSSSGSEGEWGWMKTLGPPAVAEWPSMVGKASSSFLAEKRSAWYGSW
jgi:hypothetical protein